MKTAMRDNTRAMAWGAAAVIVLLLPGLARGQDGVFVRGYTGPFGPFVRQGQWTTRRLSVVNATGADAMCDVGCLTDDPKSGKTIFSRRAIFPARSRREVELVYRPADGQAGQKSQQARGIEPRRQSYKIWNARTGQLLDTQEGNLLQIDPGPKVLGTVNSNHIPRDTSSYLKDPKNSTAFGWLKTVVARPQALPDRWYGYSMLDMLTLGDIDIGQLRPSQVDAMLRWVRLGGTIIFTGHENMHKVLRGQIGQAAGVGSLGSHWVDRFHAKKTDSQAVEVVLDWPMPQAELYVTDAKVLISADTLPLLTHRRVGRGHVFTLALPLVAAKPVGMFDPWSEIRRAIRVAEPLETDKFFRPAQATLKQIAGRPGPTKIVPVSILLAITACVILGGLALQFIRRGELLWVVLIPAWLVLAVGLYVHSRGLTSPQRLSNIGLITPLGDGQVRVQQAFAYCSGPVEQKPTFSAGQGQGIISPASRALAVAREISRVETTDSTVIIPAKVVPPNATRGFYVDTVVPSPGVQASLTFDDSGVVGQISNLLPQPVNDAVVLTNFKTYRLGSLQADIPTPVRIGPPELLGEVDVSRVWPKSRTSQKRRNAKSRKPRPRRKPRATRAATGPRIEVAGEFTSSLTPDKRRNDLLAKLITVPSFNRTILARPLLIGYVPGSLVDPLPDRSLTRAGWSVIAWPMRISPPKPGSEVLIPAGFVEKRLENIRSSVWNSRSMEFHSTNRPGEVVVMARPPWQGGRLRDATAILTVNIQAVGYDLTVAKARLAKNKAGMASRLKVVSRTPVETFSNPSGRLRISVPNAERFADAEGWLAFSLRVTRPTSSAKTKTARGKPSPGQDNTVMWKLDSVDVVLKGYAL